MIERAQSARLITGVNWLMKGCSGELTVQQVSEKLLPAHQMEQILFPAA